MKSSTRDQSGVSTIDGQMVSFCDSETQTDELFCGFRVARLQGTVKESKWFRNEKGQTLTGGFLVYFRSWRRWQNEVGSEW